MSETKVKDEVINLTRLHDGKVVLYQLKNRPKHLWLCRIKVPNGPGYIYRGTGTANKYEVRKFADDLLDEIRIKVKLGKAITGTNLKRLVDDRGGPGCLNRISASISGASTGVRLPSGGAAA